jgi:class 3 adenylate cyclase/tetratricopeptide (TPR) repeat protein
MTATSATCASCGTQLRDSAKFCDHCGTPVAVSPEAAEYKQVTVLFADVVGSMHLAAAVGAERFREIMSELVKRSAVVVQRYGGTVNQFTGDGVMAFFGAPAALEDHAIRACLAALGVQVEASRLSAEVNAHDGVDLQLRVGLNSGQVIAGDVASGSLGYTAFGEQVGMAQRMESVAPPGAVMLSVSTARLVENIAVLGATESVRIKGIDEPIPARRLLAVAARGSSVPAQSTLVGRGREVGTLKDLLDKSISGEGCVLGVVGPAGIGKTRIVREAVEFAKSRNVEVFSTYCESHATDIPFGVVARLLRAIEKATGLDSETARARVREQLPEADPQDLLLLDDLLGIADQAVPQPSIEADARRRRLTALINTAQLARTEPALFVIEDVHWIDDVSESMLAEFVTAVARTPAVILITYRPEYRGPLSTATAARTISLAPLTDSESSTLIGELLGTDPTVEGIAELIAQRAAGNPFFAEEIVRELTERGVLTGDRGSYTCSSAITEVSVPATLQATIAARIDRLGPAAKRAVSAAAVIGSQFTSDLLVSLGIEPALEEAENAELVDRMAAVYAFRHPLIRAVAYESQLKSDRAETHRRLAAVMQERDPGAVDENAALIAEHLEAAGDADAAFDWHMRAGVWAANRDIRAARQSWERARHIADALAAHGSGSTSMRIAPRMLLCGSAWQGVYPHVFTRFQELQELCALADDKASLVVGMAGMVATQMLYGRVEEASAMASEYMQLLQAIADPTLTVGLSVVAIFAKLEMGGSTDALRWSEAAIELADGDPTKGNIIMGSPLAAATVLRGLARCFLGRAGWREDLDRAVTMARATDPLTYVLVVAYKYVPLIPGGALPADDKAMREIEEALEIAEKVSDDDTLGNARLAMGLALVHRESPDYERGLELLDRVREMTLQERYSSLEMPLADVYAARDQARRGDFERALPLIRAAIEVFLRRTQVPWAIAATHVLVETLLGRGDQRDVLEARDVIDRLTAAMDGSFVLGEVILLRMRLMLSRACGDDGDFPGLFDRYRRLANELDLRGHMAMADAMN